MFNKSYQVPKYPHKVSNLILRTVEKIYSFVSLLFFTNALNFSSIFLDSEGLDNSLARSPISLLIGLIRYSIYAFTILIVLMRYKIILRIVFKEPFILLLTMMALLSIIWSDFPNLTIRYSLFALGTTLFGIYFAARFSLNEQMKFLAGVIGTIAVVNLLFTLAFPEYGIEQGVHAGAWRGIFWHKNNLGGLMAFGGILFSIITLTSKKYRYLSSVLCSLNILLLVLSNSKNALIIFLAALLLLLLCYPLKWTSLISIPLFLSAFLLSCSLIIFLIDRLNTILIILGKDISLSGRTDIWSAVLEKLGERPLLGYGYQAFWVKNGEAFNIWRQLNFKAVHSHNGFLDLTIQLGILGILVFLCSLVLTYIRSVIYIRKTKTTESFWFLIFISLFVMYNLSEAQIFVADSFLWSIYVATAFSVSYYRPISPEKSQQNI